MTAWKEAYIALGANLGERERTICTALRMLHQCDDIRVTRCSAVYETDPVGYEDQPAFLNMTARVVTTLEPLALLDVMLGIEHQLGRVRDIRNGPRTIDLDILWMNGHISNNDRLILPHPRMGERLFVLVPLSDIVLEQEKDLHAFVRERLGTLEGKEGIRLWGRFESANEFVLSASSGD
ncbi:2-amino-4-hydroxy-6-hydroxymethyldihydropteridine diphosphokinase [Paenibacillus sp. UMB4589-SE434]|uniref:2-amino-4-hydroxy-6- hydroxymethyldihydropteridine diphosphokinase n=1 Tax=Paenibacillus sp. UMB4589-SE434 TaxID=3046314 RepID=UPI00254D210D|nr:2-amino-4-hydroxy-6-hydroxymethyldihydropteridine diphosphokinase [Paenibacillus sp. UMB4589-SE434]MDK8184131.1 2-amino-4-hydroxy-6-hydroxymethyldihydropteridine diphosphokinase [Paenibacillus sp. UMB4589-SE434]